MAAAAPERDAGEVPSDPLSEVLSMLKPRSYVSAGFEAGGDWSIEFTEQTEHIKCYAIVRGECWLTVQGVAEPLRLREGECFVLPSGRSFVMATDLSLPPLPHKRVFPPPGAGGVVRHNGGGDFFLVGSRFGVSGAHAPMLLALLPPIVRVRQASEQAALRWSVERMMAELREPQPGSALIVQHLAHMMLVQSLRLCQAEGPAVGAGWLLALTDKTLGAALYAMHHDPASPWTLQSLAERACLSRSAFAQKFREAVGMPPLAYLTRWRMLLAADRLAHSTEPVAHIAEALGYASESAFSTAFKRVMGTPPRLFGQAQGRRRAVLALTPVADLLASAETVPA